MMFDNGWHFNVPSGGVRFVPGSARGIGKWFRELSNKLPTYPNDFSADYLLYW